MDDEDERRLLDVIGEVPLETWTAARSNSDAADALQANGVSAMPVMGPVAHCADPHLTGRGFIAIQPR